MENTLKINEATLMAISSISDQTKNALRIKFMRPDTKLFGLKKINWRITNRVIELQDKGFYFDFIQTGTQDYLCIQDNSRFHANEFEIILIDQGFDRFSLSYKYIHTVESFSGIKGILISDHICSHSYSV